MNSHRLLILDDNAALAMSLKHIASHAGFNVKTSACPKQAIEVALNWNADLLLCDYEMPFYNGLEVATRIRGLGSNAGIILMSGRTALIDRTKADELSILKILEKPFGMSALMEALNACITCSVFSNREGVP